jgi:hypothetical protein
MAMSIQAVGIILGAAVSGGATSKRRFDVSICIHVDDLANTHHTTDIESYNPFSVAM